MNKEAKIFSTQFHPEGSPGPFDTKWIFSTPCKMKQQKILLLGSGALKIGELGV